MVVGPNFEKPKVNVPDSWTHAIQSDNSAPFTGSQRWWQKFNDPTLDKLIKISRKSNPNIQIAKARITESWYQRSVLAAAWYPKSDFNGRDDYGLLTYDRNSVKWDFNHSHGQLAQIEMGWDIDLFGKVKRQVESATAEYQAKIEGWRDAIVFINSEVALHYIAYRTLKSRIANAKEATQSYLNIKNMVSTLHDNGITSKLELHEAKGRLKSSQAEVPRLTQDSIVIRNRLAALLGMQPGDLSSLLSKNLAIPKPPSSIASGFPVQMLRSRPDIRRAERKIAAQTARIGVATAELYPQLSLSGALSYEYLRRGVTVETLRRTLGLGPSLKWRIFHACADQDRIKEQEAKLTQAIVTYESTVINAVTQVENSLTRIHYSSERLSLLNAAAVENKKAAELMQAAYQLGEVDLRRLLNAQQDYIRNKDEAIATKGRRAAHSVRLFKSLGGGELPQPASKTKASSTASDR
jgi:multidrug efflux system outer membrane protein